MIGLLRRRPVLGWAVYDWANSAFSLSIVTAFLPVVLTGVWNDGAESTVTTARLGFSPTASHRCSSHSCRRSPARLRTGWVGESGCSQDSSSSALP